MYRSKNYHIVFFITILFYVSLEGQTAQQKLPIQDVLKDIESLHQIQFNYSSSLLDNIFVLQLSSNLSLDEKIMSLAKQTSLNFSKVGRSIFTITYALQLCGYLKDSETLQPLNGATIQSTIDNTVSDNNGFFELKVADSKKLISIRYLGYKTIFRSLVMSEIGVCDHILLDKQIETILPVIINGYLVQGIDKRSDGSASLNFSKFSLLPGLIEADVLQSVQALPGIQSIDETVSNINIRGGSHDQNLILWDDIKMYQSGHFFGLISSFNPQITESVKVITNGSDASYTDGVSGTIHMKTSKSLQTKFKGTISANFLNTDIFTDIPIGKRSSLQLAARRSVDDWIRTPTYDQYFERVIQATEVEDNDINVVNSNQDFNFYDTSFRWLYHPSEKDELRVNFILINNDLTFNETAVLVNEETRKSSLSQNSIAGGVSYQRQWNDNWSTDLKIYETDYKLQAINSDVLLQQQFLQENTVSETGIKLAGKYRKNTSWQFKGGYNLVETEITDLNDVDLPRFRRLNSDVVRTHAVFGQVNYLTKNNSFNIIPGIRFNYIDKFSVFILEPRLSIRQRLSDHIQIEMLGEFKHQNTSQIVTIQNDFLGIEKRRWQLTDNDSIPILKSKQASVGITYNNKDWLIDLKGYYKTVDGITTRSQSFTTKYEFAKEIGSYDVFGMDALLRKRFGNIYCWMSYSYMNNQYTFENLEEVKFPSNFDNTHSFNIGSTYSHSNLNISVGLNYRRGKPTSIPAQENSVINDEVNFGPANENRLEDYLRVDLSGVYKFKIAKNFHSEIGASIWNLLNKENTINNYYQIGQEGAPNKFSRFSLGTTTNLMVRLHF